MDWEKLTRTAHWTNSTLNYATMAKRIPPRVFTSEIKLKTTINQGEYFGPTLPTGIEASLPTPLLLLRNQKQ